MMVLRKLLYSTAKYSSVGGNFASIGRIGVLNDKGMFSEDSGVHTSAITLLTWSPEGSRLITGDQVRQRCLSHFSFFFAVSVVGLLLAGLIDHICGVRRMAW